MARTYNYGELVEKTNGELREICQSLGITGMSKARKDVIMEAILSKAGSTANNQTSSATAPRYTKEGLLELTNSDLREICQELSISGMSKKPKDELVAAILSKIGVASAPVRSTVTGPSIGGISTMEITMKNTVVNPNSSSDRIKSTIHVSCGASSGNFNVIGKTVGQVAEFLKEVLNIGSNIPRALACGKEVGLNYVIQENDNLEYLKTSGRKG
jgi:hypothetical protein